MPGPDRRRLGTPGGSALAAYDDEVRRRRGRLAASLALVVVAVAAGWWAVGRAGPLLDHGRSYPGAPFPVSALVAAVVAVVAAVLAWSVRPVPDPERWARGAVGEVATAELLDRLPRRWWVLHDLTVPGSRSNLDHLVVGPRGVWAVDSKAYRAPLRAGVRSVRVGDRRLDTSAVAWEAEVVGEHLGVEIRPLVVVHGTGLSRRGRRCDGVRVVPAAGLVRRIRRERVGPRLTRAERRAVWDAACEELVRD